MLGFFGFANFYQIPEAAKRAVPNAVKKYVDEQDPTLLQRIQEVAAAAEENADQAKKSRDALAAILSDAKESAGVLRVQSGTIRLHKDENPTLMQPDLTPNRRRPDRAGERGAMNANATIQFKEPFASPPVVIVGINMIDLLADTNHRLSVQVNHITKEGFSYTFTTWLDTKLWAAEANWLAVGN